MTVRPSRASRGVPAWGRALPVCLLSLLAGCGGGGSGGGGGPPPPPPPPPPGSTFTPHFPLADVRLDTDPSLTPGTHQAPKMAWADPNLYVVWQDERSGLADVYLNRSADAGVSWLATAARIPRIGAGQFAAFDPQVCASGNSVYVAWVDARNGALDVYFNRSLDGGATWLAADVRLDTDVAGAAQSQGLKLACNGATVYALWQDARNGLPDVYFNRSADGGATWLPLDARLDTDVAGAAGSLQPVLAAEGTNVFAVWTDGRNGGTDIYVRRSVDGGLTWGPNEVRVDTNLAGTANSSTPFAAIAGANVYVAWQDFRAGGSQVFLNHSTDGGATWQANDRKIPTTGMGALPTLHPVIQAAGAHVRVFWEDGRNGGLEVRMNRSTDAGATWLASDVRIETDPVGTGTSSQIDASGDETVVFAVWSDTRTGHADIRLNASIDAGATWLTSDLRIDEDPAGAVDSTRPRVLSIGERVRVVWEDARNGGLDVYFNRSDPVP